MQHQETESKCGSFPIESKVKVRNSAALHEANQQEEGTETRPNDNTSAAVVQHRGAGGWGGAPHLLS